jgi:hypothetical protein
VGEMIVRFWDPVEYFSCLETSGSRVCDLVLGPADGQAHLVTRLEEAVGRLQVMHDEHQALQNLTT